jgi:hypothetical protein
VKHKELVSVLFSSSWERGNGGSWGRWGSLKGPLTGNWPSCAPVTCVFQSHVALCRSNHCLSHRWSTWSRRQREICQCQSKTQGTHSIVFSLFFAAYIQMLGVQQSHLVMRLTEVIYWHCFQLKLQTWNLQRKSGNQRAKGTNCFPLGKAKSNAKLWGVTSPIHRGFAMAWCSARHRISQ